MLSSFRPSFEVVGEGRILYKIKHLQDLLWVSFWLEPVWNLNWNVIRNMRLVFVYTILLVVAGSIPT